MGEVAEAADGVVRDLELEEEGLARIEHAEGARGAWLPEIHFIDRRLDGAEIAEPVEVSGGDEAAHGINSLTACEGRLVSAIISPSAEGHVAAPRLGLLLVASLVPALTHWAT